MASFEDLISGLTAALTANTAALTAAGGGKPAAAATGAKATGAKATGTKAAAKATSKFTADQVRDKLIEVKTNVGEDEAKELIASSGYEKLAQLVADPSKFDAVMAAAEELLAGGGDGGADEDSGL